METASFPVWSDVSLQEEATEQELNFTAEPESVTIIEIT